MRAAETVRWIRRGVTAVAVLAVAWLLWQARGGLGPFIVGGVFAFLLAPLVERLAKLFPFYDIRRELARTIAIAVIYVSGTVAIAVAGALIIPTIIDQTTELVESLPEYVERARVQTEDWTRIYRERVPVEAQQRIEQTLERLGQSMGEFGQRALNRGFGAVTNVFNIVIGYVVVPFWLFYVLKDRHRIAPAIRGWFPPGVREDVDQIIRIIQRVLGSYIRGQLILGLFIGVLTWVGLTLLGIQGAVVLALIAGVTELIPVLGPILGAIPAIIVTLATDPGKIWWVLLFYIGLQQVENAVLVPRVQGNSMNMHPALIIVLLVVAQQLSGFVGMLVAVPLAGVARELFRYVLRRLREQEEELAHPPVLRISRRTLQPAAAAGTSDAAAEPAPRMGAFAADPATPEARNGATPPTTADDEARMQLVRRALVALFNDRDLSAADEYFAGATAAQERRRAIAVLDAFPDLHVTIDEQFIAGDRVVTRWTATGTQAGTFLTIAPSDRTVTWSGTWVHQVRDGTIVDGTEHWDTLALLEQLRAPDTTTHE